MVSAAESRGQLLLVGGIAIAIVFLLSIILTNSLVVTSYTATPESADRIEEVEDRETAVQQDLTVIADAVRDNTTFSNYNSTLNESFRNYTQYRTRVSSTQSGVYINATMNGTASEGGYLTADSATSPGAGIRPPGGGSTNWDLGTSVGSVAVFNFTATGTTSAGPPSATFDIIVENASSTWQLEVSAAPAGVGDVAVDPPGPAGPTTYCSNTTSGGEIEVDLLAGRCTDGSGSPSSFPTFDDTLDGPYTRIHIVRGNKLEGTLWYASTGTVPNKEGGYPVTPAVDLTYTGPQTGYNRTVMLENST